MLAGEKPRPKERKKPMTVTIPAKVTIKIKAPSSIPAKHPAEKGAPIPAPSSKFWNDWCANNGGSPAAKGFAKFASNGGIIKALSFFTSPTGILGSAAKPVNS